MVINHIYMQYVSAKVFANPTFNGADIVKNTNFLWNCLKIDILENVYFLTLFVKKLTKSFFPTYFVADRYLVCKKSIFYFLSVVSP